MEESTTSAKITHHGQNLGKETHTPFAQQFEQVAVPIAAHSFEKSIWIHPKSRSEHPKNALRILEIGPGYGEFLLYLASAYPQAELLAIELKKRRFLHVIKALESEYPGRLTAFCGHAQDVCRRLIPAQSIDEIHIQFPDPWPKRRHEKHRLMQPELLPVFATLLKPKGLVHFATDVESYAQDVALLFAGNPSFISATTPPIQTTPTARFNSYFSKKWQALGKTFYYQTYILIS